jgi:hypothetical protein
LAPVLSVMFPPSFELLLQEIKKADSPISAAGKVANFMNVSV